MRASLFSFFMLIQLYALAQNKQIVGRLVDQSTQKPIASASVMVKNNDQKSLLSKQQIRREISLLQPIKV